jgi:hypothetical protein
VGEWVSGSVATTEGIKKGKGFGGKKKEAGSRLRKGGTKTNSGTWANREYGNQKLQ